MGELNNNQLNEDEFFEDNELSHTNKIVGLFSEPSKTFRKIAQTPSKIIDWLVPLLVFIIVSSISIIVMQTNPQIKYSSMEKQTVAIEKKLDVIVESGQITREQADIQLEMIRKRMEDGGLTILIPQIIGFVFFTSISFFIISGFFLLISKFVLKSDGQYGDSLVAYGLPFYILVLQVILQLVIAMLMSKMITDLSVTTFLDLDKTKFIGFLLSKLDLFSIWFYVVVGIAFSKMFRSENTLKYIGIIVCLWLGISFLSFFLSNEIPFLSFLK
ncbi:MAG: YIP1 family protein [Bacteroidetes bacterium]|nr:YIP1 family protein [Bacteroidota bacterium]MBU1116595.1 YIP1 family protein [Bacteroidota bacterium]MBU1797183.1 YIP1 family protein [Bacteroidota bacterium]